MRTAEAAGCDALLLSDPATDIFNANVVRASQGALFSLTVGTGRPEEVVAWLHSHDIAIVTLTPEAKIPIWEADLTEPTAFVVGSEDCGLGRAWKSAAKCRLQIPMAGRSDSLNVSATAAIALFEAVRQRRSRR